MPLDCFELGEFCRGAMLKEGRLLVDRHSQENGVGSLLNEEEQLIVRRMLRHNAIEAWPTGKRADGTLPAQVVTGI